MSHEVSGGAGKRFGSDHSKPMFRSMWLELTRRFAVIILSVAIGAGLMVRAAQSEPYHGHLTVSAVVGSAHQSTGAHGGCAGDQTGKVQFTCSASCASVGPAPALGFMFKTVVPEPLSPAVDLAMIDHTVPPDPYPPKS